MTTTTPTPAPQARPVACVESTTEQTHDGPRVTWHVSTTWTGVETDRRSGLGWAVGNRPLADRLARAINAGAVFGPAEIRSETISGRTYIHAEACVMGRYLNKDLQRLGF